MTGLRASACKAGVPCPDRGEATGCLRAAAAEKVSPAALRTSRHREGQRRSKGAALALHGFLGLVGVGIGAEAEEAAHALLAGLRGPVAEESGASEAVLEQEEEAVAAHPTKPLEHRLARTLFHLDIQY